MQTLQVVRLRVSVLACQVKLMRQVGHRRASHDWLCCEPVTERASAKLDMEPERS